tara:strand:+ start:1903 stop:2208 length:306 start_codon:yes stop_codon:yes gene_type:complete
MEQLYIQIARTDLLSIKTRIKISVEEIQEKAPERKNYINPMLEAINQIDYVYNVLDSLETKLNTSRQRNYDLELINLKLIQELENTRQEMKIQKKIEESNI